MIQRNTLCVVEDWLSHSWKPVTLIHQMNTVWINKFWILQISMLARQMALQFVVHVTTLVRPTRWISYTCQIYIDPHEQIFYT
jgi:hypothetical protein